jgi:hypothetical protein
MYNVGFWSFTRKTATEVSADTMETFRHSTRLNAVRQSYTLNFKRENLRRRNDVEVEWLAITLIREVLGSNLYQIQAILICSRDI